MWPPCYNCQILDLIYFQNNLIWPNSNTAEISLDSGLKYSKITHRYAKKTLSIYLALVLKTFHWCRFHPFDLSISPALWHKCQTVFWFSCTSPSSPGSAKSRIDPDHWEQTLIVGFNLAPPPRISANQVTRNSSCGPVLETHNNTANQF